MAPLIGRTFTEAEQSDPSRASSVVVLSYAFWERRFGGDTSVVGQKPLNGNPTEVIGVMPAVSTILLPTSNSGNLSITRPSNFGNGRT